nr:hypothetical protein [Tanacetum cinerariifolium]
MLSRRKRSITFDDNVLFDPDEAFEYAKLVSIEETQYQEKERQTKHKHAGIMLERQVNKEVDEGKESKKQAILKEIKRKDTREGSGVASESPDHSSFSDDSYESATDDKTESERESDHDESYNDCEHGDESDKSISDEERTESDESDKESNNVDDRTEDFVIKPHDKELEQPPKSLLSPSPSITTTSAVDYTRYLNDPKDVRMTELLNEPGEKRKRRRKDVGESLSKKSKAQEDSPHYERSNDADEPSQEDEQEHEVQNNDVPGKDNPEWFQKKAKELLVQNWFNELVDAEEEPKEFEYKDGSVTIFGKLVKKIFKKDKITKEDVEGPLGRKRIPVSHFFNHDLEYLKYGTKENTYALSVTKIKAARYEDESRHDDYSKLNIISAQSIKVNKQYGYAYLEEIVVIKIDEKEIVIKKRVEDIQMRVESYQTKLNLTKPQLMEGCLHQKTLYTVLSHPKGVVYEGTDYKKMLMRADELNKFCDGIKFSTSMK